MTLTPTGTPTGTVPPTPPATAAGPEETLAESTPESSAESTAAASAATPRAPWWRDAVIYQVYPRSFADGDGDGIGDLAGVRQHLAYIRDLGADAIWFTPWYASPLVDGGYDVADYRAIHPDFGDLAEAEALIAEAAELGLRVIVDIVPNHVSDRHAWFQDALAAAPGSPERDRFWFRDGLGPAGDIAPTAWPSSFAGATWTRTTDPDGAPGQWYLHLFAPEQPDLNWADDEVRREHEDVLRFWFDRGVAGIRIDSAALLVKDADLPEVRDSHPAGEHPNVDRDEVHDIYRDWRRIADGYDGERVLVGEVWLADQERFSRYLRPDEMHLAFNFDFMVRPWDAAQLRAAIDQTLASHAVVGAPPTWVLSNHDVTRPVTRYGRADSAFDFAAKRFGTPTDLVLGARRARAAALLAAALPGALYVYQGDELGLPEVEDLPSSALQDPMHFRSEGVDPGRDGCRVPLPWGSGGANAGFSPAGGAAPWLPPPEGWERFSVERQSADPTSSLSLYRRMLALRGTSEGPVGSADAGITWLAAPDGVLAFARGATFSAVVNLGTDAVAIPADRRILLASADLDDGMLPPDTAVWLSSAPPLRTTELPTTEHRTTALPTHLADAPRIHD